MSLSTVCLALALSASPPPAPPHWHPPALEAAAEGPCGHWLHLTADWQHAGAIARPPGASHSYWALRDSRLAGALTSEHLVGSPQVDIHVLFTRVKLLGDDHEGLDAVARADWEPFHEEHPIRMTYGVGYHHEGGFHVLADLTEGPEAPIYQVSTGVSF